jgi:hypothetical protein
VTSSTGTTNPAQITTALPTAITQAPASSGARISAPARIAASQNSASAAASKLFQPGKARPDTRSQMRPITSPARVAAPMAARLMKI